MAENPLRLIRKKNNLLAVTKTSSQSRVLDDAEWVALLQIIEEGAEAGEQVQFKKQRLKMMVYLFYFLGLRVSELVHCKWSDFAKINEDWRLYVVGKGSKLGKIPVNDELFLAIQNIG